MAALRTEALNLSSMLPRLALRASPSAAQAQCRRTLSSFTTVRLTTSQPRPTLRPALTHSFTTSSALSKKGSAKGGKKGRNSEDEDPAPSSKGGAAAGAEDPFDFSDLSEGISKAVSKLKDDLSKLRAGGRFNSEALEALRVHLVKGAKESVRLGDVAQVIPKGGRSVSLLVGEEDHVKPITSAIQSSNLSLTPQPDPHNSLQLNIPIPPPTKESRMATVNEAKSAMEKAALAVRNARGAQQKKMRAMTLKKVARPDDLKKAHDQMEKVAEKGQSEVKSVYDAAKKALESA